MRCWCRWENDTATSGSPIAATVPCAVFYPRRIRLRLKPGGRHQRLVVRSACDPWLDAMTRTWIFDALREISGENFGDDALLWRAWYAAVTGSDAPISKALT